MDVTGSALGSLRRGGAHRELRWCADGVGVRKKQLGRKRESGSKKGVERPGVMGWDSGPDGGQTHSSESLFRIEMVPLAQPHYYQ